MHLVNGAVGTYNYVSGASPEDAKYEKLLLSHAIPIALMKRPDQIVELQKQIVEYKQYIDFLKNSSSSEDEIKIANSRVNALQDMLEQAESKTDTEQEAIKIRDFAIAFAENK